MHLTRIILVVALFLTTLSISAQTSSDEIARLKALLTTSEERARQAEKIAEQYKIMVERERHESDRRRNIAIAYAVAEKSKEIPDAELRKLLALQAFNFNKNNYGYIYQSAIFEALIGALHAENKIESLDVDSDTKAVSANTEEVYYVSNENKLIRRWRNGKTWENKTIAQLEKNISAGVINLSPNGQALAICINNRSNTATKFINLYNIQNIEGQPKKIENIKGKVEALMITDDGTTFFTATNNEKVNSYRVDAGNLPVQSLGQTSLFDLNGNTKQLLTLTSTGKIKLLDFEKNMSDSISVQDNRKVTAIRLFPNNKGFVVGFEDGAINIFSDSKDGRRTALVNSTSSIVKIAFNKSQSLLAVANADNSVRIWRLENLRENPMTIKSQPETVKNIAFSDEGEIDNHGINQK